MTFTAIIHREGDIFVASCAEVGSISQGESMEQALQNLREATELYLEEFPTTTATDPSFITTFQTTLA